MKDYISNFYALIPWGNLHGEIKDIFPSFRWLGNKENITVTRLAVCYHRYSLNVCWMYQRREMRDSRICVEWDSVGDNQEVIQNSLSLV